MRILVLLFIPLYAFGLASCSDGHDHDPGHDPDHDGAHHHAAPHGGTLVAFGEEFLHVELQLSKKSGQLTAYILDGEAEQSVRIAQGELELSVTKDGAVFPVKLSAHASTLTGETAGDTSEFRGESEHLVGLARFEGRFTKLVAKGRTFENVEFRFPEGNE